jgi:hypothetical protein
MTVRYFPLDGNDFRLTMGLQALKNRSILDIDEYYAEDIAEKRRLLREHRDHVFAEIDATEEAQKQIYQLVFDDLADHHPGVKAERFLDEPSPLVQAAMIVQEDLVLMRATEEGYILAAACVCFPTGWNLVEKIGRPMQTVHQPVPGLNDRLGSPIDRFFRNLRPGKKVERFNWGLYDSDKLFQPGWWRHDRPVDPSITSNNIGDKIFFRVERQTLQRLGSRNDILFTIRIFNNSLSEICKDRSRGERLLHGVQTMGRHMRDYKSLPRYQTLITDYLKKALS